MRVTSLNALLIAITILAPLASGKPLVKGNGKSGKKENGAKGKKKNKGKRPKRDEQPHVPDDLANTANFIPAISLEAFKSVDPELFEWIEKDDIKAGETTCGFLKALLGSIPDTLYPIVNVYVCVKFAKKQPAPKGNLAVHCGGPSTLSNCVYIMGGASFIGSENVDDYNIIGFDQRGMGRSTPSFMVDECDIKDYSAQYYMDLTNEDSILAWAEKLKERVTSCWPHDDFQLEVEDEETNSTKSYHFLEYSGTRQLAEDIERVRMIFGDQPLSIFGLSYGTKVMGTYATIFPRNVHLFVLDSCDDPGNDIVSNARDIAESSNQRLDYILYSCSFLNLQDPGACPVDMTTCVNDMKNVVEGLYKSDPNDEVFAFYGPPHAVMNALIGFLYDDFSPTKVTEICTAAETEDIDTLRNVVYFYMNEAGGNRNLQANQVVNVLSKPSDDLNIYRLLGRYIVGSVAQDMVTAQDYINGAYSDERFVNFLMELNEEYPGAGTQQPALATIQWYGALFYWPKNTPVAPIGNPQLTGVIAGQQYDPWTPYKWTVDMRERFKYTSMLTSRSTNHGLSNAQDFSSLDVRCVENYHRYFHYGFVDFVDGTVCDADLAAATCSIEAALTGGQCY